MHTDASTVTLTLLASHELSVFQSTAADAQFAPSVRDTVELSRVSGYALNNFERLVSRVEQLGGDILALMEQFAPSFRAFKERTQPKDWHESLMKSYVHEGLIKDYVRASRPELDADSQDVVTAVLNDTRREDLLRERLGELISVNNSLGSRLALWGRKLVVETAARLGELRELTGGSAHSESPGAQMRAGSLDGAAWQTALLGHSRRMSAIGLVA